MGKGRRTEENAQDDSEKSLLKTPECYPNSKKLTQTV